MKLLGIIGFTFTTIRSQFKNLIRATAKIFKKKVTLLLWRWSFPITNCLHLFFPISSWHFIVRFKADLWMIQLENVIIFFFFCSWSIRIEKQQFFQKRMLSSQTLDCASENHKALLNGIIRDNHFTEVRQWGLKARKVPTMRNDLPAQRLTHTHRNKHTYLHP